MKYGIGPQNEIGAYLEEERLEMEVAWGFVGVTSLASDSEAEEIGLSVKVAL